MGVEDYKEALKLGQKAYRRAATAGRYPYLSVLDDILAMQQIESETNLGLVEIPMKHIVGTRTAGRTKAFAENFMPLLEEGSEFSSKWIALCDSLIEEGIREPIKAYEFLNRFYILEGNKRVSAMKYLGAVTIPAQVIRLLPARTGTDENRLYYEFVDFYSCSGINYLDFTKPGSYKRLQLSLGKEPEKKWTEEERREFRAFFSRFETAYEEKTGGRASVGSSDALLVYLNIYPYETAKNHFGKELKGNIAKIREEVAAGGTEDVVALSMQPETEGKGKFLSRIVETAKAGKVWKVAFINDKNASSSSWTYGHELGRIYLEEKLGGKVKTSAYFDVDVNHFQNCMDVIEKAAADGNDVIFTTTPKMLSQSIQAAVNHPEVKILNCSLGSSHPSLRTYYGRMYEAKFLLGIIAGSLSENDEIGYIADYPIYGMTANINAFAIGAKMVNPRAKVILEWSTVENHDIYDSMRKSGVCFVSDRDMIVPDKASREFGLYYLQNEKDDIVPRNMAMPIWHWGRFYELILRSIATGAWKDHEPQEGVKALNYWWGMAAGVVDLVSSKSLPEATGRLVRLFKSDICTNTFHIFSGILRDQTGSIRHEADDPMSPEQIMTMDWLADNVIGEIPQPDALTEEAKQVVAVQGVNKKEEDAVV